MRKKFFGLVAILVFIVGIITTYGYMKIKDSSKEVFLANTENISSVTENTISNVNASSQISKVEALQQQYNNLDVKAILSIDNSEFSYPVVQTVDNEYYLNHNYNKEYNSLGSIYADYRVNLEAGRKILIFGHSSTKTDTPFNQLEKYYEKDYYKSHKYITLETKNNSYQYEIFSVYVETSDFTYMNLNFETQEDWYLHILKLQKKSLYSTNIQLTKEDDILILQTCSNHPNYKKNSKKYLLLISRRVK